jgi:hypothetical protein
VLNEIRDVIGRAQQGDAAVLPRLRELLAQFPLLAETYGNLAVHAEKAWAALAAGTDLHLSECLLHQAATMRQELAGPSPGPVERLLAERVVACWLQLHYFDAVEAQALAAGGTPRLAAHRARRQAVAHRNYLTALAALTTLRRLLPATATVPAAIPATPTPTPAAANGASTNGRHAKGSPPTFDPRNRIADLFDPAANGMGPRASAKQQAPCITEVQG